MSQDNSTIERLRRVAKFNRVSPHHTDDFDDSDEEELLRDSLNAAFFRTTEKWMLPKWAIDTIWSRGSRQEISESLSNNKYRNWIVIGGPGSRSYAISDNTGLVTVLEECGSLDFWPRPEEILFPALEEYDGSRLNLVTVDDQMYEWKAASGPLEYNRLIYHVIEDDREYIFNEIVLRNLSLESQRITFFVALRPTSIRGIEPIESMRYDPSKRMLFSNENLALISDTAPTKVVMDTFDNPNLIGFLDEDADRIDQSYTAARGNGTAILKYTINLRPAGQETVVFASPLFKSSENGTSITVNMNPRLRDDAVARWFDFNDDSPKGSYPDEELMMATAQGKTSLVIQARRFVSDMSEDKLLSKGPEMARIHASLSRSGCSDIANIIAQEIVERFGSLEITMADVGFISPLIWAFTEMARIYTSTPLTGQVTTFIDKIGALIEESIQDVLERKKASEQPEPPLDHYPDISLMEARDSTTSIDSEELTSDDESLEVDIGSTDSDPPYEKPEPTTPPTLHDVLESVWILAAADYIKSKREGLEGLIQPYGDYIEDICKTVLNDHTWSIESEDDLHLIMEIIGAFGLLKGKYFDIPLIEKLTQEIGDSALFRGLFRFPKPKSRVSSHMRIRFANAVMLLGDRLEVEVTIEKLVEYLSEYHFLPEWINVDTKGGASGDGCSIMAAADLRLLLRDILIYERDGNLFIFPGLPEDWFTSTSSIIAEGIPTEIGVVGLETGVSANQHQIEIELESLPEEMDVFLPSHIPLHMVKVFGGSIIERFEEPKRIRLVPLSERITLTFHR